jgi:hypothetical protein
MLVRAIIEAELHRLTRLARCIHTALMRTQGIRLRLRQITLADSELPVTCSDSIGVRHDDVICPVVDPYGQRRNARRRPRSTARKHRRGSQDRAAGAC